MVGNARTCQTLGREQMEKWRSRLWPGVCAKPPFPTTTINIFTPALCALLPKRLTFLSFCSLKISLSNAILSKEEVKNRGKQGPTDCFLIFCELANIPDHSRFFGLIFILWRTKILFHDYYCHYSFLRNDGLQKVTWNLWNCLVVRRLLLVRLNVKLWSASKRLSIWLGFRGSKFLFITGKCSFF